MLEAIKIVKEKYNVRIVVSIYGVRSRESVFVPTHEECCPIGAAIGVSKTRGFLGDIRYGAVPELEMTIETQEKKLSGWMVFQ